MGRVSESITTINTLIIGGNTSTIGVTIQQGQNLSRGTVLGRKEFACPTTGTAGTNTGNGTITLVKGGKSTLIGTYTILVTSILANTYSNVRVTNPLGKVLGNVVVGAANSEVADFTSDEISFRVTNGTTDFAATDSFTVAVSGKIPSSATVTGTGNGTLPQVEARERMVKGTYKVKCVSAGTDSAGFQVLNPSSEVVGELPGSLYAGTGNGTLTEVTAGPNFKRKGAYVVKCITAVTNGGIFSVTNPDGVVIGNVTITAGASGTGIFQSSEISFKLTDGSTDFAANDQFDLNWFEGQDVACLVWIGSTDFIVGDYFNIVVAIAKQECVIVNSDNTDGSQFPVAILAQDVNATSAPVNAAAYNAGKFDELQLIFGGNDIIDTHRKALIEIGIITAASVKAFDIGE